MKRNRKQKSELRRRGETVVEDDEDSDGDATIFGLSYLIIRAAYWDMSI